MITTREKEILDIIKKNPLIAQEDIAGILDIKRSSVAVHISNLQKKGLIKGKGYILNEKPYIFVLGGSNIDIQGFVNNKFINGDSNPGSVKSSKGGVGRNIAENLIRLNKEVKLMTILGDDFYGREILNYNKSIGINMESTIITKEASTSTYLSLLDEKKELVGAISSMEIMDKISIEDLIKNDHVIRNSKLIVLDTNIPKEIIDYIIVNYKDKDIFIDTVSVSKTKKVKEIIGAFHTIKPNLLEAEELVGFSLREKSDLMRAGEELIKKGVKNVFISLGKDGVYYKDDLKEGFSKPLSVNVLNTAGAGDSFMAGLVYGYLKNEPIEDSVKLASIMANFALSYEDTINPNISEEKLIKKLKEMDLNEK